MKTAIVNIGTIVSGDWQSPFAQETHPGGAVPAPARLHAGAALSAVTPTT
jgi:hypothetical protein